jgi:TetR/AcrR family transcriptional regulator
MAIATKKSGRKAGQDSEERIRARNEAAILEAALDLFSRKGFDGARMAEVAEQSGLPKANVYYYFPAKEDIYRALIDRLIASWDTALEELQPERDPAEAIAAYIRAKLDYSRGFAAQSKLFANEILSGAKFLDRAGRRHVQEATRAKARVIEGWIADGRMVPIDIPHFFIMLWSTTQFYADFDVLACDALETAKLTKKDYDAAAEAICALVLRGCGLSPVIQST